jgi:hypothetical protein
VTTEPPSEAEIDESVFHRVTSQVERGYASSTAYRVVATRIGMPYTEVRGRYWRHVQAWLSRQEAAR